MPDRMFRALRYVPPAVLAAIIAPALLMPDGKTLDLAPTKAYLVAGIAAGLIAWRTKNLLLTIVLGMAIFLLLRGSVSSQIARMIRRISGREAPMDSYELADLMVEQRESGKLYLEFLRVPALSMGVYTLPAGSEDSQQPHTEDEVYYVTHGMATIRVGDEDQPVVPGSIVYVPARVDHRFHDITRRLDRAGLFRARRIHAIRRA